MYAPRHRRRAVVRGTWLVLSLVSATQVAHAAPPTGGEWVIPGGQEAVVSTMLGGREGIAGCVYESAQIERVRVRARFTCGPGAARPSVELEHRPEGSCEGLCAATFRIEITDSAGIPPGFATSLLENVRRSESRFAFVRLEARPARPRPGPRPRRTRIPWERIQVVVVPLVLAFVLARLVMRMREVD